MWAREKPVILEITGSLLLSFLVALQRPCSRNVDRILKYRSRHYIDGIFKPSKSSPINPEVTDQSFVPEYIVSAFRQPHRQLSDEEIQQIVQKYGTGKSTYVLADEYGCHRRTICSALKDAGVIVSNKATTRDAGLTENVLRLHNNHIRVVDIGKKLGISESTVRRILRENGV